MTMGYLGNNPSRIMLHIHSRGLMVLYLKGLCLIIYYFHRVDYILKSLACWLQFGPLPQKQVSKGKMYFIVI